MSKNQSDGATSNVAGLFLVFLGMAVVAWGLTWLVLEVKKDQESRTWPTTTGKITSSGVAEITIEGDTDYYLDVSYEYQVAGVQFSSDRVRFCLKPRVFQSDAEEWARQYPVGNAVAVSYDALDPGQSVLWPGEGTRFVLRHCAFFTLWGLIAAALVFRSARKVSATE